MSVCERERGREGGRERMWVCVCDGECVRVRVRETNTEWQRVCVILEHATYCSDMHV